LGDKYLVLHAETGLWCFRRDFLPANILQVTYCKLIVTTHSDGIDMCDIFGIIIHFCRLYSVYGLSRQVSIERQNPWWHEQNFSIGVPRLNRYPDISLFLSLPEILVLLGARRTGKIRTDMSAILS
jgi:hypothetical protein